MAPEHVCTGVESGRMLAGLYVFDARHLGRRVSWGIYLIEAVYRCSSTLAGKVVLRVENIFTKLGKLAIEIMCDSAKID